MAASGGGWGIGGAVDTAATAGAGVAPLEEIRFDSARYREALDFLSRSHETSIPDLRKFFTRIGSAPADASKAKVLATASVFFCNCVRYAVSQPEVNLEEFEALSRGLTELLAKEPSLKEDFLATSNGISFHIAGDAAEEFIETIPLEVFTSAPTLVHFMRVEDGKHFLRLPSDCKKELFQSYLHLHTGILNAEVPEETFFEMFLSYYLCLSRARRRGVSQEVLMELLKLSDQFMDDEGSKKICDGLERRLVSDISVENIASLFAETGFFRDNKAFSELINALLSYLLKVSVRLDTLEAVLGEIRANEHLNGCLQAMPLDLDLTSTKFSEGALGQIIGAFPSLVGLNLVTTNVTDADLTHLRGLRQLTSLNLAGCAITNAGLVHLAGLTQLKTVDLSWCYGITDAGLVHLAGLTQLKTLKLRECYGITDAGLRALARLRQLTTLNLGGCRAITDAGLGALAGLTHLRVLRD